MGDHAWDRMTLELLIAVDEVVYRQQGKWRRSFGRVNLFELREALNHEIANSRRKIRREEEEEQLTVAQDRAVYPVPQHRCHVMVKHPDRDDSHGPCYAMLPCGRHGGVSEQA